MTLRLYLRFYLALLASLFLFGLLAAVVWHLTGGPMEQAGATLSAVVQNVLPSADAPATEQEEALRRLAAGLKGRVTLFGKDGSVIATVGPPLPPPAPNRHRIVLFSHWQGGTVSAVRLADGRILVASAPLGFRSPRAIVHLMLILLASAIGVAAFPVVRQLSRRLERLQHGVELLGQGDLTARVAVEGHDEVARLAASFNRAAGQIERLVQANQSLLANASHELRTPLARIRLAIELLKGGADARTRAGLTADIAELDELVDEILLTSRLDAVKHMEVSEEIDLLALAAEECARYDDVHLEGEAIRIQGDPRLLRRLLRNLLENARRHGAPPTEVRLARSDTAAVLTVWDAGPGPLPAEWDKLFSPFFRPSGSRGSTGFGLGLSLVRQIARRHGGDAGCTTLEDGRSAFRITLAA